MHNACLEVLREDLGRAFVDRQEIVGGMDSLPDGFYAELQNEIRLGAEGHAIAQADESVTGDSAIQGALESGLRAAPEIARAPAPAAASSRVPA
jgi:monoamine oxidase